ncbi:MAG: hypothetical protein FJX74_11285 [Armatimonadetes bacterium]|nr:hypothetical protein [Armatimonadota bacterium]
MATTEPFKECTACGTHWGDYREFVIDRELRVEGFQASHVAPEYDLILVTHRCGTTLAVWADALRVLADEPAGAAPEPYVPEARPAWVAPVLACLRRHELPQGARLS